MREHLRHPVRAFTMVELLILVFFIALVGFALLTTVLGRARTAGPYIKCRTHVKQLHEGLILFSEGNQNRYPEPIALSAATASSSIARGNSSANIHSIMIYNNFYSPELTICPQETSRFVVEKIDFDYCGNKTTLAPSNEWDTRFDCEITGRNGRVSNVSYANLAPTGDRWKDEWTGSLNSSFAVLGDRGPRDGKADPTSISDKNHGRGDIWVGNAVFNDNHVEELMIPRNRPAPYTSMVDNAGNILIDTIFAEDDPANGSDIWLSIFVQNEKDPESYVPLWD